MPTYTLNTTFTDQDLQRFLASGSNVVVAKPNAGGTPNVAWVVFRPLLGNSMSWEDEYGIYASNVELTSAGARLNQMSWTPYPAEDANTYELSPAGSFVGPIGPGPKGSYKATNLYDNLPKGYLTFGLYQRSEVNGNQMGNNAVSAAPVIYNSDATITPFTTIYLWIQSQVVSNSVLTVVTSPQTKVTFGGNVTDISLVYDASSGLFRKPSNTELAAGIALDYVDPAL